MVININGLTGIQSSTSHNREKPLAQDDGASSAGGNTSSSKTGTDRVNLSAGAKDLQNIESSLKDFPEVNQDRVAQIKQAIRDGSYTVDPERLAAKITQFEQEL
ncbi:MAG: negative regulator of flagellin synthesis FlgM [Candidatus Azotimanducaceae bacterium]|jgi:negative regulator of flagellin synthesis FlgM